MIMLYKWICYTNTKLDGIYGVHPPICDFSVSATEVLFNQNNCLKSYNQNNNNNHYNNKNPHKLFLVLQLSTSGIPVTSSTICTAVRHKKRNNAVHESWKLFDVQCSEEDEEHSIRSTDALLHVNTKVYFCHPKQSTTLEQVWSPPKPMKSNKRLQVVHTLASLLAHFWFYGTRLTGNGRQPWKLISDQKHSTTIAITSRKLRSSTWPCCTHLKCYNMHWLDSKLGNRCFTSFCDSILMIFHQQ